MLLSKGENTLTLTLEAEDKGKTLYDLINDDVLFWADITYTHSGHDGWQYFYDANRDLVFSLDNYGWDWMTDLIRDREVTLHGVPNGEDYEDMEWNEGRE